MNGVKRGDDSYETLLLPNTFLIRFVFRYPAWGLSSAWESTRLKTVVSGVQIPEAPQALPSS